MDIWPLASTDDHVLATTSDIEREHEMRKREISLGGLRQVAKQREQSGLIQSQSQCGKLLSNGSNPDLYKISRNAVSCLATRAIRT